MPVAGVLLVLLATTLVAPDLARISADLKKALLARDESAIHENWTRLDHAVLASADHHGLADRCVPLIELWLRRERPDVVFRTLDRELHHIAGLLPDLEPRARRRLLGHVADRLAKQRGLTSVDVLTRSVECAAVLLGPASTGEHGLDAITADLVVVFTERDTNGVKRASSGEYRRRGLTDSGFHPDYRDGSDQVRHFCWAIRLFVVNEHPTLVDVLLALKEIRDAKRRKKQLDVADLRLNGASRRFVTAIRSSPRPAGKGRPTAGVPLRDYAARIRRVLTSPGGK